LREKEIPLVARIFAIVDVFDALIGNRPYRKAWSREKALDHIEQESGRYFDPQIVDIFLKLINEQTL
jgi:HD-GYP domain-containing protein (c-di-GMP phosphodiesterase class II)